MCCDSTAKLKDRGTKSAMKVEERILKVMFLHYEEIPKVSHLNMGNSNFVAVDVSFHLTPPTLYGNAGGKKNGLLTPTYCMTVSIPSMTMTVGTPLLRL